MKILKTYYLKAHEYFSSFHDFLIETFYFSSPYFYFKLVLSSWAAIKVKIFRLPPKHCLSPTHGQQHTTQDT